MSKRESVVVSVILGVACPYLTGMICWWTSATLLLSGAIGISERSIAAAAFAGVAAGIVLDAIWLKRWVANIYTASFALLVPVYLACSVIAVASFMGLPIGNLILGALAGVYVGRRISNAGANAMFADRAIRGTGWFTAAITSSEAFAIGLLALREKSTAKALAAFFNVTEREIAGSVGIAVIFALVVVLAIIQFWGTSTAARLALHAGKSSDG